MNKKNIANTKVLMKNRTIETNSIQNLYPNKILLTDLCPQEKAKVGELIKTLQVRKLENEELSNQITVLKSEISSVSQRQRDLISSLEEKDGQIQQLDEEIDQLNQLGLQKDVEIQKIHLQFRKMSKKSEMKNSSTEIDCTLIETREEYVQTNERKQKMKNRCFQVNLGDNSRQHSNTFYRPNSKSFEKIMKGGKDSHTTREEGKTRKNWGREIEPEADSEDDDDFEALAKKFIELKEKNVMKIKQQYEQNQKQGRYSQHSQHRYGRPRHQPEEQSSPEESNDHDFDEEELNRILKSKNFSASRLLRKSTHSHSSSRQKSINKKSHEKLKSHTKMQSLQKMKGMKLGQQNPIDFYESDLLVDLVTELNP